MLSLSFSAGSISSCDAFLNVFQSKGLRPEVICPCASSAEALTVAIRRWEEYWHIDHSLTLLLQLVFINSHFSIQNI